MLWPTVLTGVTLLHAAVTYHFWRGRRDSRLHLASLAKRVRALQMWSHTRVAPAFHSPRETDPHERKTTVVPSSMGR